MNIHRITFAFSAVISYNKATCGVFEKLRSDLGYIKNIQIEIVDKDIEDFSTLFLGKCINDILHHHSADFHFGANQIIALGPVVSHPDAALLQHLCQFLEIQQHRASAHTERINEITQ